MDKVIQKYRDDILNYCKMNNIGDIDLFVGQCFKQGFDIKKYGFLGGNSTPTEVIKEVEKIVEVEVIKEVPVEKIIEKEIEVIKEIEKIVEVIKEVPVEVIKEVEKVVTKIEYINDKTSENELVLKIHDLEELISKKDENLDELRRTLDERPKEVKITEYIEKVIIDTKNEEILLQRIEKLEELITKKDENLDKVRRELDIVLDELKIEKSNIKTVEVIKEIPVEVIVEKIVEVKNDVDNDNNKTYLLQETLQKLRRQLNEKDSEIKKLENIIKELEESLRIKGTVFMKNSNINDKI
jgi:hypothetical protein